MTMKPSVLAVASIYGYTRPISLVAPWMRVVDVRYPYLTLTPSQVYLGAGRWVMR